MKEVILPIFLVFAIYSVKGQDLPTTPEPGKCYVKYVTPDVYEKQQIQIKLTPAYKKLEIIPAKYNQVKEKVLVKPAHNSKIDLGLDSWKIDTIYYHAIEPTKTFNIIPATFSYNKETIEIKAASAKWSSQEPEYSCSSEKSGDRNYWCYVSTPAKYETFDVKILSNDSKKEVVETPAQKKFYIKYSLKRSVSNNEELDIPPTYQTIVKNITYEKSRVKEKNIPATYKTIVKDVLVQKGGLTSWKAVECELVYNENFFTKYKKFYEDTPPYDQTVIEYPINSKCSVGDDFFRGKLKNYRYYHPDGILYFYKDVDLIETRFKDFYLIEVFSVDLSKKGQLKFNVKYFKSPNRTLSNPARTDLSKNNFEPLRTELKKCINGK
ncbi:hypothetical protein [Tenacibaculum sp. MAR_2009_124]|uniref:hypothetical protein n=1 Tax=Tenacibaculum sp. MAR_2009_124 TaxID=1250059 RepID=UPI00115FB6EB|nr:hypothetical protein [Tenacibaculum sp. MAR_2009_124]